MTRTAPTLLVLLLSTTFLGAAVNERISREVTQRIRSQVAAAGERPQIKVGEIFLSSASETAEFYRRREFRPAWSDPNNALLEQADAVISAIRNAPDHGLRSSDYHLSTLERAAGRARDLEPNSARLAGLDLLLTDAFLTYGSDLVRGRIDPRTVGAEWFIDSPTANLVDIASNALESGRVAAALRSLVPSSSGYTRLVKALAQYREIESRGGWRVIPAGPTMKKGVRDPRVKALRKRLVIAADMGATTQDADLFDDAVEGGVKRFQSRHSLPQSGVAAAETLAAMNVPVAERIDQIVLNMERARWFPEPLGSYVTVNIANYSLDLMEDEKLRTHMRVVVGKSYRRTPAVSSQFESIVFSPYWNIPDSVAVNDILPRLIKNPGYLAEQRIKVFQGASTTPIDPRSVKWSKLNENNFPYRLRQEPGAANAMGRIKFTFPNRFGLYLHDTNEPELFKKTVRTYSSGCIRIEKPVELARYLLDDEKRWSSKAITAAMRAGKESTERVKRTVPVHLVYSTAWVAEDGTVHFERDIYSRDGRLLDALRGTG